MCSPNSIHLHRSPEFNTPISTTDTVNITRESAQDNARYRHQKHQASLPIRWQRLRRLPQDPPAGILLLSPGTIPNARPGTHKAARYSSRRALEGRTVSGMQCQRKGRERSLQASSCPFANGHLFRLTIA